MGFIYATRNGRQVLACDVCMDSPARKIPCPYGYCQATASCANCKPRVKAADHSHCKQRSEEMKFDQAAMRGGRCGVIMLYHCKGQFGQPDFYRIRDDRQGFAACCIFSKTWVDDPEIQQLRLWGNDVQYEAPSA